MHAINYFNHAFTQQLTHQLFML